MTSFRREMKEIILINKSNVKTIRLGYGRRLSYAEFGEPAGVPCSPQEHQKRMVLS
jgi:hypothetical protein